jgi:hypothetical protein
MGRARAARRPVIGASIAVALGGLLWLGHGALRRGAVGKGGCPFSAPAFPEQAEALRARAMLPLRGEGIAPARSALGFTLGATTRGEVSDWAARQGVACAPEQGANALRCTGVPAAGPEEAGAPGEDGTGNLYALFDPSGRLVALDVMRESSPVETVARRFDVVRRRLASSLGPPSASWGEATAAYLGARPLRQAAAQFRFADFAADVTATNLAGRGVVLREQYRSIPAAPGGG